MNRKSYFTAAAVLALAALTAGCDNKKDSDGGASANTSAGETTSAAEPEPPVPAEASDPNAVTFDDGRFDFAFTEDADPDCASGKLSVEEVMGNKMLRFADDNIVPLDKKVQKVGISAAKLLGNEAAARVRKVEFDLYARATAANLATDDAEGVFAPGWIGGGGGTVISDNKTWYAFQEFEGGEYNFETSGAVHVKFKFLLAESGQCWSEDMEDANFLVMRWGIANESDLFIDNIVFYDGDGKSIPLAQSVAEDTTAADTAEEETSVTE